MARPLHWTLSIAAFLVAVFLIVPRVEKGTQVCTRCAAQREVHRLGPLQTFPDPEPCTVRTWLEAHAGACSTHRWRNSGCWSSLRGVSCTEIPDGHRLLQALARLDDAPATEMARRFAALGPGRQLDVWKDSSLSPPFDDTPMDLATARAIAHGSAARAGWKDLADAWSP